MIEHEHQPLFADGFCGARSLSIIYKRFGLIIPQQRIAFETGFDPQIGMYIADIKEHLGRNGFNFLESTYTHWDTLRDLHSTGKYSLIVGWNQDDDDHYSVVHDVTPTEIHLVGEGSMLREVFEKAWHAVEEDLAGNQLFFNRWLMGVSRGRTQVT